MGIRCTKASGTLELDGADDWAEAPNGDAPSTNPIRGAQNLMRCGLILSPAFALLRLENENFAARSALLASRGHKQLPPIGHEESGLRAEAG